MSQESTRFHHHSIRLKGYDYSQEGCYYITIVTHDRACSLGDIKNGEMNLSDLGKIAYQCWIEIPEHFNGVELPALVIMPNHLHGIISLNQVDVGARYTEPFRARHGVPLQQNAESFGKPTIGSIPTIVRAYKSSVTRIFRQSTIKTIAINVIWQKNYYEHVVRSEKDMYEIGQYIDGNIGNWSSDKENCNR